MSTLTYLVTDFYLMGSRRLATYVLARLRAFRDCWSDPYTVVVGGDPRSSDPDKGGDLLINIRGGVAQSISLVPNSVEERHPKEKGQDTPFHLLDSILDEGVDLGTVEGGLESAGFVVFQVKVSVK